MNRKLSVLILSCILFLSKNLLAANYEAYKIFLQGAFDLKAGRINAGIKNYEKVISLDENALMVYKDLIHLYWQSGNYDRVFQLAGKVKANNFDANNPQTTNFLATFYKPDIAEKLLAEHIGQDAITYNHLGDTYVALEKNKEAWSAYSLSYNFKQDKNVKKKLNIVQSKIPQEDLYKQMLLRSESNYDKTLSFKTGYKAKLSSNLFSRKFYILFTYAKGKNIRIDFPATFVIGGMSLTITNGVASILPKAAEEEIPRELSYIVAQLCKIFSGNFYKQFSDAKVTRNGKHLTYSTDNAELTLNMDTALIEQFSQNNIVVKIVKHENLFISKIPAKIKFVSSDLNINGTLEVTKITLITDTTEQ
ncbi:MAG: hypothetical protein LE180_00445 [Endomicrobium sp.]|uniref:tetratricopeptide repeat protein n=1 Tax=Candidatus Endomicrobiellum pyrsonymphae TaxID=1408203 RepID=UPI003574B9D7|nr:hypothetical protein [Endomicrobium sp.]